MINWMFYSQKQNVYRIRLSLRIISKPIYSSKFSYMWKMLLKYVSFRWKTLLVHALDFLVCIPLIQRACYAAIDHQAYSLSVNAF